MADLAIPEFGRLTKLPDKKPHTYVWVWEIDGQPITFTTTQILDYKLVFRKILGYNLDIVGHGKMLCKNLPASAAVTKEQWRDFLNKAMAPLREAEKLKQRQVRLK